MKYIISVTEPVSGKTVEWPSFRLVTALHQARLEQKSGAKVSVRNEDGEHVWPKDGGK